MNKKSVVVVMFVFVAIALASCNMPNQQGYSGEMMNQPNYNEEMPFEEQPQEMFEDPDAMHHEEEMQEGEWHEEEPREQEPREEEPREPHGEVHIVHYAANPPEIMAGDCSLLEWMIEGQGDFELNGQRVGNADTMQVCPTNSSSYALMVNGGSQQQVTVHVINNGQPQSPNQPAPTQPSNKSQGNPPQPNPTKTPSNGGFLKIVILDLKVAKIYPSSSGQIMVRVQNSGTQDVNNNIKLSCQAVQTTQNDNQVWPAFQDKTLTISLKPGEYTDFETGYARNPDIKTMKVSCQISPPAADWNTANNKLNNVKVK